MLDALERRAEFGIDLLHDRQGRLHLFRQRGRRFKVEIRLPPCASDCSTRQRRVARPSTFCLEMT
jgi:hypothetical protein